MQTGKLFEDVVYDVLSEHRADWFVPATDQQDRLHGTDGFANGIPFDLTLSIESKKGTLCGEAYVIKGSFFNVRMQLRTSNGRSEFKTPVVVVSIDTMVDIDVTVSRMIAVEMLELAVFDAAQDYWLEATEELVA